jgi:hypothetical protein
MTKLKWLYLSKLRKLNDYLNVFPQVNVDMSELYV